MRAPIAAADHRRRDRMDGHRDRAGTMAHGQWTEIEARGVLEAWKKSGQSLEGYARSRGLGAVPEGRERHREPDVLPDRAALRVERETYAADATRPTGRARRPRHRVHRSLRRPRPRIPTPPLPGGRGFPARAALCRRGRLGGATAIPMFRRSDSAKSPLPEREGRRRSAGAGVRAAFGTALAAVFVATVGRAGLAAAVAAAAAARLASLGTGLDGARARRAA
jgi:hypothetical protein